MTEKELIAKLKELRQIKPRENWVLLTKKEIFNNRDRVSDNFGFGEMLRGFRIILSHKYAFSSLVVIFVIIGLFGFSQNSLPGDFLYSIKRMTEKSQAVFVSEVNKPQASLELANKRLEELIKVAETNQVKKIAPAINEFQASVSEVARNFSKKEGAGSNAESIKKLVELEKSKQITEQILATKIETEDLDNTYKGVAEYLISDLETRSLVEGKEEVLNQMKELAEEGRYAEALELYLISQ